MQVVSHWELLAVFSNFLTLSEEQELEVMLVELWCLNKSLLYSLKRVITPAELCKIELQRDVVGLLVSVVMLLCTLQAVAHGQEQLLLHLNMPLC